MWPDLKSPSSRTGLLTIPSVWCPVFQLLGYRVFRAASNIPDTAQRRPSVWTAWLLLSVAPWLSLAALSHAALQFTELIIGSSLPLPPPPTPHPDIHVSCLKPDLTHPEITDNGAFSKGK